MTGTSRDSSGGPRVGSFAPLSLPSSRVLVLGSMPGIASLEAVQYYAHPRNLFWRINGALFGFDPALDYATRCALLLRAGVALWDVLAECERPGSLDTAIVDATSEVNDFPGFLAAHPTIGAVFFNGAKSEQVFRRRVAPRLDLSGLHLERLPSTSPAHASLGFDAKLAAWSVVRDHVTRPTSDF